jgi:hypothetical protein
MVLERSLLGRISPTWLAEQTKANPNNKHLVIVTKRPKLVEDQRAVAQRFGKTKFRVGMAALVSEAQLADYASFAKYCTHAEL